MYEPVLRARVCKLTHLKLSKKSSVTDLRPHEASLTNNTTHDIVLHNFQQVVIHILILVHARTIKPVKKKARAPAPADSMVRASAE